MSHAFFYSNTAESNPDMMAAATEVYRKFGGNSEHSINCRHGMAPGQFMAAAAEQTNTAGPVAQKNDFGSFGIS